MQASQARRISLSILVFATVIAVGSAGAVCSNATFKGVYGSIHTGFNSSGQPTASVYQITADGLGNLTGTGWTSDNGTMTLDYTITGTYALAKTCTGSATFQDQFGGVGTLNFVLDDTNKGFQEIGTVSGKAHTGFGLALGTATCGLPGLKKTFVQNLTGTVIGKGVAEVVGQLILDGKGHVSGTDTLNVNGSITTDAITGTYTQASNCTGTAQITAGGNTINFVMVGVNGAKEFLILETDSTTIVAGTAQQ